MKKVFFLKLVQVLNKKRFSKEIPVAALVVNNGKVISKGFNSRHIKNDVTGHAEINAIKRAEKKLKNWRLTDCELYVNLEPCDMCKKVIEESRIKRVYYFIPKIRKVNTKTEYIYCDDNSFEKHKQNFIKSFEKLRKKQSK